MLIIHYVEKRFTCDYYSFVGIGEQIRAGIAPPEEVVVALNAEQPIQVAKQSTPSHEFVFAMGSKMTAYKKMNNEAKMAAVRYQINRSNDRNMFSTIKTFAIEGERLIEIRRQEMLVAKEVRRCCENYLSLQQLTIFHTGTRRLYP